MDRSTQPEKAPPRICYISAGSADIIGAHRAWASGRDDPSQVSITFSGQVADFVASIDGAGLFLSFGRDPDALTDDRFTIRHLPAPSKSGMSYYAVELKKAVTAAKLARRFGATIALIDSGSIAWFALPIFGLAGIRVVPILHNVLWPAGFPPSGWKSKVKAALNIPFWRTATGPALGVSEEACRQVNAVRPKGAQPATRFFPQFRRSYFQDIPAPPPHDDRFTVIFVSRAIRSKGLMLIVEAAEIVNQRLPGIVTWIICGDGPDLAEFRKLVSDRNLDAFFDIRGWCSPSDIQSIYADVHLTIVPTTSSFLEGLAMTAVEGVLAGRPLIASSVVPAIHDLGEASLSVIPDSPESHAAAIIALYEDAELYAGLRAAAPALNRPFYSRQFGLSASLSRALSK